MHRLNWSFLVHFFGIMFFDQISEIYLISSPLTLSRWPWCQIWPFYSLSKVIYLKRKDFDKKWKSKFFQCLEWKFLPISSSPTKYHCTKLLHVSKFKNIVCLFVNRGSSRFWGGVKIGGRERFKWGFLIKIHNIMKKNYIWKSEMLMLYKEIPPKTVKRHFT